MIIEAHNYPKQFRDALEDLVSQLGKEGKAPSTRLYREYSQDCKAMAETQ